MEKITLICKTGEEYEVEFKTMQESQKIYEHFTKNQKKSLELQDVEKDHLEKVIQYCRYHQYPNLKHEEWWDQAHLKVKGTVLLGILKAAQILVIPSLISLASTEVVKNIKGKTPEQIRQAFDFENDLSPHEEEEIRKKFSEFEE